MILANDDKSASQFTRQADLTIEKLGENPEELVKVNDFAKKQVLSKIDNVGKPIIAEKIVNAIAVDNLSNNYQDEI